MKRVSIWLAVAACIAAVPNAAAAQACVGLPSLVSHPLNVAAGASFGENATGFTGRFGFGNASSFAGVSLGFQSYDDVDENSTSLGVDGGLSFPVGVSRRAAVCPIASIGYEFGPSVDTGVGNLEFGTLSLGAGAAFGGAAYTTDGLQLLPFASAQLAQARVKLEFEGESQTESETFGLLNVGMGFLFNSRFAVRPSVAIPFGLENADPVWALSFVIGFSRQ